MKESRADYEAWKTIKAHREANPITFDEWASQYSLTDDERKALVLFLAQLRYERTVEMLLPVLRHGHEPQ